MSGVYSSSIDATSMFSGVFVSPVKSCTEDVLPFFQFLGKTLERVEVVCGVE
jgi:hypothetical protein